ncbi:hypothetical protein J007_01376 [Cryptococcus neoformans]|nr:hypothetical protein C356_01380 [Cryptococcus neoformans var. grubii c45]OXB38931.1 hypothetical protein J007_01376 [Cryptococcus neoformans var. grubii]OXC63556.1 hypothetical protein C358_01379 [Cryptococcus neoformans var. grubii MW-RSA852]
MASTSDSVRVVHAGWRWMKGDIKSACVPNSTVVFYRRTMKMLLIPPGLAPIPEDDNDNFTFLSGSSSPSDTPPLTPLTTPHGSPDSISLASGNDTEVVASDGIKFYTSPELLQAASPVFAAMTRPSKSGLSSTIYFPDSLLEASPIITLFLHLLSPQSYSSLPTPTAQSFNHYETLISFLKKFQCDRALLEKLSRMMRVWLEEGCISASRIFKAGCMMGDEGLCKSAVQAGNEWTWVGESRGGSSTYPASNKRRKLNLPGSEFDLHKDGIFGSPALDISAMPYSLFRSLPDTHKFALLRATRNVAGPLVVLDQCDWDKVAEDFEKILSEVKR